MPTYEYKCLSCGALFDAFQKMSESPLEKCVECRGKVRRVVSGGSGLIFKGSGFYITDYAKGDGKKTESSEPKKKAATTITASKKPAKTSSTKTK